MELEFCLLMLGGNASLMLSGSAVTLKADEKCFIGCAVGVDRCGDVGVAFCPSRCAGNLAKYCGAGFGILDA